MSAGERGRAAALRLFKEYAREIYRFARFSVGDPSDAEDIVQEVFLAALTSWDAYRGGASERTWLLSIARRKIADHLRTARREAVGHAPERTMPVVGVSLDSFTLLDLESALKRLTTPQRQVFALRIVEDRPAAEVAQVLGRSPVWVRVTLHRALRRLRAHLSSAEGASMGGGDGS